MLNMFQDTQRSIMQWRFRITYSELHIHRGIPSDVRSIRTGIEPVAYCYKYMATYCGLNVKHNRWKSRFWKLAPSNGILRKSHAILKYNFCNYTWAISRYSWGAKRLILRNLKGRPRDTEGWTADSEVK